MKQLLILIILIIIYSCNKPEIKEAKEHYDIKIDSFIYDKDSYNNDIKFQLLLLVTNNMEIKDGDVITISLGVTVNQYEFKISDKDTLIIRSIRN